MRRGVFETIRRGLDNALANWGLIVVRVVEMFILVAITIAAVLAMVVPVLVSIGIGIAELTTAEDVQTAMMTLMEKWTLVVWIFAGILLLTIVLVALHSVVEAGCARVLIDGDRMAGPEVEGPRARYRVFSMQRFWAGARSGWWTVFWIYNLAWSVAGVVLLLPLLPTLVLTLVFREEPTVAITAGCIGLVLSGMLMIVVGIVTGLWTNRAIADWAAEHVGARPALAGAWAAIKRDFGRHLLIAIAMIVIAIAGSSFFATFSFLATFGESMNRTISINFFTFPLRIAGTLLNWGFSSFVANWLMGAFGALAVEGRRSTEE